MATPRRMRILLAVGAIAAYLAVVAGYTRAALFDSQGFGDRTVEAVRSEPVRHALAVAFADALIEQEPRLISARPVLIGGAESVLQSEASGGVISRAARDVHRGLLTEDEPSVIVDLADLSVLVRAYLQTSGSEVDLSRLNTGRADLFAAISERSAATRAAHLAAQVSVVALIAPLVALLAFAGAIAAAGDRRRGLRDTGLALMLVGALAVSTKAAVMGLAVTQLSASAPTDLVHAVLQAYLGGLTLWALAVAGAGGLLAAAAATLMGPVDASGLPRLLWRRLTAVPESAPARVARGALLLLAGALVLGSPEAAVTLAAELGGGYLALLGLTSLLGELLGPATSAGASRGGRRALIAVAGVAVAVPVVASLVIAARTSSGDPVRSIGAADDRCNGDVALCDRRLDQVVFPTVHNAMSNAADGFLNANNASSIERQLDGGVRGLLIDALAGQRNENGVVRTDLRGTTQEKVEAQIGAEGLAAAQRLAGRVAFGPQTGPQQLYLCHVLCELGATEATDAFRELRDWLERHPREVLIIFIQDEARPEPIVAALRDSGLADLAPTLAPGTPLPTLSELIRTGKRAVLLAENRAGAPWYPAGFTLAQDTPYTFENAAALERDSSCAPNRGVPDAPMLLVNHWIETYPPNPRNAEVVNTRAMLLDRARRCMRVRGRVPTLLAVDFSERGDLVGAARELNRELLEATTP